jgi:ADP-ribosylglycohydrolase
MLGAIIGDIIGSRFEFDRPGWSKDFKLFTAGNMFTDDTVMTVAVARGLQRAGVNASEEIIKRNCIQSMQQLGREYPNAGYGSSFIFWLDEEDPEPYNSYGNGSAMRVSAAGWMYDDLERTKEVARWTAEISHNHPEGIKGAEATAAAIYMLRNGWTKERMKAHIEGEYGYDLSKTCDELRPLHAHIENCMDSMPKAFAALMEGTSYEDVVRNAVSLGGDTDTLAAIAGSMAEAYYGIPESIRKKAITQYLPPEFWQIINAFETEYGKR